ncbi:Arylsulfatase regulator (Fe-S oxidoreductase) [Mucinivorans hirudinis]|uniref:Arylsulfatase regulator (Fe-S oxidoreductase) n=1 Tax=Mucinivorans hirudinis TaxID=1433126 RepID=A0A060R9I0_9BACT|nr:Arylsulfatase regulator (Fe-S oxidoreductase) [Mucinivorans hirudinis]
MDSYAFLSTSSGNRYLYNAKHLSMINVHPAIEFIHKLHKNNDSDSLNSMVQAEYPYLTEEEVDTYIAKYDYLLNLGFFEDMDIGSTLSGKVTTQTVENQLNNLDHIVFQVTSDCNFSCKYCCFGEMYDDDKTQIRHYMTIEKVKQTFAYFIPRWRANKKNNSSPRIVSVGFYGGEPLLNISLIKETIEYCKELEVELSLQFVYSMTTNGMLLDRYMDYIVENNFSLLCSLDGDRKADSLRVNKRGEATFDKVFTNIRRLKREYPEYFKEKVNFSSVLNHNATVEEVNRFIMDEFDKAPLISPISEVGLKKEKFEEFTNITNEYRETMEVIIARKEQSGRVKTLGGFFYYNLNNAFKHYSELLHHTKRSEKKIPTGTCLPFYKKMYITADNKIFACERIESKYVLGTLDDAIHLDSEAIAAEYNKYLDFVKEQCMECYLADTCSECIFQFPINKEGMPMCKYRYSKDMYQQHLSAMFELLETNPEIFEIANKMVFA